MDNPNTKNDVIETEEKKLISNEPNPNQQYKKILLKATELKLNITICEGLLKSLNFDQTDEQITNQLLDLYYQDELQQKNKDLSQLPPIEGFVFPKYFSNKIMTSSENNSTFIEKKESLKKKPSSFHQKITIYEKPELKGEFCPICYENMEENKKQFGCGHGFCKDCIILYFKNKIMTSQLEYFKCPNEKCIYKIPESTILNLLDNTLKAKYNEFKLNKEIEKDINRKWCVKPGCTGIISRNEFHYNYGKCFCGQEICFICGNEWHPNKECVEVLDEGLKKYLNEANTKSCPNCRQIIEKTIGCNVMLCPFCHFTFCWVCLKKYEIGHFSIFNRNGCPGMDSTNFKGELTKKKRRIEICKGITKFFFKILLYILVAILIYPILPFVTIISLIKKRRQLRGRRFRCDCRSFKDICDAILCGFIYGLSLYVYCPFIFLLFCCNLFIFNPHVAYNYPQTRRDL